MIDFSGIMMAWNHFKHNNIFGNTKESQEMYITEREVKQAYLNYRCSYGGIKEDYFALLYISKEFKKEPEEIAHQVAFGGNDYGIDAFYFDEMRKNLYLYQFKWSKDARLFKDSFKRLISAGMERIFGNPHPDEKKNQLLVQLKSALKENRSIIERVFMIFVFNGDQTDLNAANNSATLDYLKEDLEGKKYYICDYFERDVDFIIQFAANRLKTEPNDPKPHRYTLNVGQQITCKTPNGEELYFSVIPIMELYDIYSDMGHRFFDKNIRGELSAEKIPNRAIRQTLKDIVLKSNDIPEAFVFKHNGVTLSVEHIECHGEIMTITEPRLLNGAQTVSSLAKFIDDNTDNQAFKSSSGILDSIKVLAKIVIAKHKDFVVNVTICNNRQNPVWPWNLRANDLIQCDLQDKFIDLGIYYERQENVLNLYRENDLDDMGIESTKAIKIKLLAQTFLAVQGETALMSQLPKVFEHEKTYRNTFRESYLQSDVRKIVLAYKIQFRLSRIIREIREKGRNKYEYLGKARNLIWALLVQALLNDSKIEQLCEDYGTNLGGGVEQRFKELLLTLASAKVRLIISEAMKEDIYKQQIIEDKYDFLRQKAMYKCCMDIAQKKYGWQRQSF